MTSLPNVAAPPARARTAGRRLRPALRLGAALALCLAAGALVWQASFAWQVDALAAANRPRLDFYATVLAQKLEEFRYLPAVVGMDQRIGAVLAEPGAPGRVDAANRYLASIRPDATISAIFITDRDGLTLAASNWGEETSFVGHNYAFRPYFQDALAGRAGRFYGIGATTLEPGYFLSSPILREGRIVGVAVVKVLLGALERDWQKSGDLLLVADDTGVLLIASPARWRYRALRALPEDVVRRLRSTRQYADADLSPLSDAAGAPLPVFDAPQQVRFTAADGPGEGKHAGHGRYLVQSLPIDPPGWRLLMLTDLAAARDAALSNAVAAGFATAFLLSLGVYAHLRRRRRHERLASQRALQRANDELEQRIAERTGELLQANRELRERVGALKEAERMLTETRDAAIQGGKLAVLGQMAAGITHEINQPLTALTTLADNAVRFLDIGRGPDVRANLDHISQLAQRMGRIVAQLKTFARRDKVQVQPVPVADAVDNAALLVESRRRAAEVALHIRHADPALVVMADPTRLEQVLLNLLLNACDAVEGRAERRIEIASGRDDADALIVLRDSGPGFDPEVMAHLFEAFFTTKPAGKGLGLGLALSRLLVDSLGGRLTAANDPAGGARFEIRLPLA